MAFINSILNVAALLLWLGWRDMMAGALLQNSRTPLARTLRRAGPSEWTRWKYLGALAALILLRAVAYWWIGAAVNWTPHLRVGVIVLPFRNELLGSMVLFSLSSFGIALAVFYLALLLLSLVNRDVSDAEMPQKFVRAHLGRIERLPFAVKLLLPVIVTTVFWLALGPLLSYWEMIPRTALVGVRLRQGLLIGVSLCLAWKYVIAGVLLVHFLNSHIYFGNHPLWSFVNLTSRRMLAPLRWLPLQLGRMDFAPVAGIVLVFLLAEVLEHWLPKIYPA